MSEIKIEINTQGGAFITGGEFHNTEFVANKHVYIHEKPAKPQYDDIVEAEEVVEEVQEPTQSDIVESKPNPSPSKSAFYNIVQHGEPTKLVERLHQLIDGRGGADVGSVLLKCIQDGYLTRKPTQKEFTSEFTLKGSWTSIHNYMNDNSENALDRANKIIIF